MIDPVPVLIVICILLCIFGLAFCIVQTIEEVQAHRLYRRRRCQLRASIARRTWA